MASFFQKYHLKWPWTPRQVENLDEMLSLLFAQAADKETLTSSTGSGTIVSSAGFPGSDGTPGEDGLPGPPGVAGVAGATGATGPGGPIGTPGTDGTDGLDGLSIPGPVGPTGATGGTGPAGPIGLGIDGVDGVDGLGFPGPVGPQGAQGNDGTTGAAGGVIFWSDNGADGDNGNPGPMGATGATGAAGAGTPWTLVKKTSDTSRNNNAGGGANVVVADPELLFAMLANTTYIIRGVFFLSLEEANIGNDIRCRFGGPASPVAVVGEVRRTGSSLAYSARQLNGYDASNLSMGSQGAAATAQPGIAWFDIMVQNGANAGNFTFSWISADSLANSATVRKGSYMEYFVL